MEKTIYQKLAEAKKEIGKISKDSTNPFFGQKYFDINTLLEHVEPVLEKHNLMISQPIKDGSVCSVIVDLDDGSMLESILKLPELTDPQKLGSCITYYRRYTLQSLLALQSEDDDANLASKKPSKVSNDDKPWLNQTTKDGQETREWANIQAKIDTGIINSLSQIMDAYKVSKVLQAELKKLL